MKKLILLASLAASGMFASCQHDAPTPQPAPRELPPMGPRPTPVEPLPVPTTLPTKPHTQGGEAVPVPDAQPAAFDMRQMKQSDGQQIVPSSIKPDGGILYDAGAPLPPVPDAPPLPQMRDAGQPMSP